MKIKHNAEQRAAINFDIRKNALVEAGPGTGKTFVIVKRAEWLAEQESINACDIRLVTFTKLATKELESRMKEQCRDGMKVSTFNSWCSQLLKKFSVRYSKFRLLSHDKPENKEKLSEQKKFLLNVVSNSGFNTVKDIDKFASMISYQKNRCLMVKEATKEKYPDIDLPNVTVKHIVTNYKVFKANAKKLDYDDQLCFVLEEMNRDKMFLRKVSLEQKFLLVDEVQDLSTVQWKILHKLSENGVKIFCVGDPAQSILTFRGADPVFLKNFSNNFERTKVFPLIKNYRSNCGIVHLCNWVRPLSGLKFTKFVGRKVLGTEKPLLIEFNDLKETCEWIVSNIAKHQSSSENDLSIMVLFSTKNHIDSFISKLKKEGVKATRNSNRSKKVRVLNMHQAKGLASDLCYLVDPRLEMRPVVDKLSENNLLYVSMSRAKTELIICKSKCGTLPYIDNEKGARYPLDIIPEKLVDFKLK